MKKVLITLIVIVAILAGIWFVSSRSDSGVNNQANSSSANGLVVAVVNDEQISRAEYDALTAQIATQQGFDPATLDAENANLLREQVIDSLVSQALLRQAVEEAGVTAEESAVEERLTVIKSQFENDEAYTQALSAEGLTEEDLRGQISSELATEAYLEQEIEFSSITATEAEVEEAYNEVAVGDNVPPLEEVYGQVEMMVIQQKQQVLITALVESLRADAEVEILI
ncbi:MAG: SurA N-terminal domain-containing protein [Candidatus Paceibacterota bacterium]